MSNNRAAAEHLKWHNKQINCPMYIFSIISIMFIVFLKIYFKRTVTTISQV